VYYYNTVRRVYETYPWTFQGQTYNINYRVVEGPAVSVKNNNDGGVATTNILLIHGFGANVNHFRYNIPVLASAAASYRVYAIDLLGFGASDKPNNVQYCMELFFALCTDFINDMNRKQEQQQQQQQSQQQQQQQRQRQPSPACCWFVAGNSIGGLTALGVARALPQTIQGVILFACADGMSFFRYTPDTFPVYTWPLVWFFQHVVLSPLVGGAFFQNFKTRDNVERVLRGQVYVNATHVDDELLEILLAPGDDVGAQDVFLKVMAGAPGPRPGDILPLVTCPILALWGERDPWTTIYGPAGAPFRALAASSSCAGDGDSTSTTSRSVELVIIPNAGHCVMDEVPDIVHGRMIPWMDAVLQRYDPRQQQQVQKE
jgi:pimeloyl-ACP methyl ester carboxylesterase